MKPYDFEEKKKYISISFDVSVRKFICFQEQERRRQHMLLLKALEQRKKQEVCNQYLISALASQDLLAANSTGNA